MCEARREASSVAPAPRSRALRDGGGGGRCPPVAGARGQARPRSRRGGGGGGCLARHGGLRSALHCRGRGSQSQSTKLPCGVFSAVWLWEGEEKAQEELILAWRVV